MTCSLPIGAPRVGAGDWFFSLNPGSARVMRHLARGGRAYVLDDGWLVEREGEQSRRIVRADGVPSTIAGLARHNIANALAAAGGARALGFSIAQVAAGLRDFRNTPDLLPGRLNLWRLGNRLVIVDYAHNVAGLDVLLDTAEALVGRRGRRRATLSVIIGSAGDRPDDYIRALAAAGRSARRRGGNQGRDPLPAWPQPGERHRRAARGAALSGRRRRRPCRSTKTRSTPSAASSPPRTTGCHGRRDAARPRGDVPPAAR